MSFLRPAATATLHRWREALAGAAVTGFGLWWMATGRGFYFGAGVCAVLLGGALIFTGLRHAAFRRDGEAPGLVEVDEGRVTYLGPVIGGSVALADLRDITFRRTTAGEAFWRLRGTDPQPLIIPAGARGVDQLLDAFTALPRFDTGAMVRAVQSRTPCALTIWRHPNAVALT
jgi:hypothetical protein